MSPWLLRNCFTCIACLCLFSGLFSFVGQQSWFLKLVKGNNSAHADMSSQLSLATASVTSAGVRMPRLIYGTAWKKERSADLVYQALVAGFRGVDTAGQPKHYREDLVGQGIARAMKDAQISREDLFIQTKFTSLNGQDPAAGIPYDTNASLTEQVQQSFKKSLDNLQTAYVDSLVLHSPMPSHSQTMEVYRVFESFHASGKARQLGISNIYSLDDLSAIYKAASVKPAVVQNRFYQQKRYDKGIRSFCKEHDIRYQSFWTLTANSHLLSSAPLLSVAKRMSISPEQALYKLVIALGITPLDGTKNPTHMQEDLAILSRLNPDGRGEGFQLTHWWHGLK